MANIQGQIQVGPSHQARLPALQQDVPVTMCESREELVWRPNAIADVDLLMYLRAARSMAAFVGWCDGGSTDDGCAAASMDETTINSLQLLHDNAYDVGRALQALVKVINPKSADRRWSDDDAKRFVKGLKQHGKNFFKIRRDLLPSKNTSQLVEYYYLWKKSATASTTRPHRQHRRLQALRRQAPTPTPPSSESVEEPSSPSDGSDNEIESDEGSDRLVTSATDYVCVHCKSTKSGSWFESGGSKSGSMMCASCKTFRCASGAASGESPPFMFRPVKDEDATADNDQQLESASSIDGGTETSDDGTSGSAERATPCSNVTRCSSTGPATSDKDAAVSICQSKVSSVPLKTEVELSENTSLSGLSGVPVVTAVSSGKVEQPEDWKRLETDDWKGWKEEASEPAAASLSVAHCADSQVVGSATTTAEPLTAALSTEVCDMRQIKTEQGLNYSTVRSSASSSEVRAGRVVASVAPCTPIQLNEQTSPWKVPLPSHPPPLLHSTSHDQSSTSPLQTSVIQSPVVIDDTSSLSQNDSDDSEQEIRNRSPSPEPRLINEECHRSKNAIFVRRWFRGRTTCARCDVEFRPYSHSALADKRDSAVSKTPVKHNPVGPTAGPKDLRKPEPRPEEKKSHTPLESRGIDAQITSTLLGYGADLTPGVHPRGYPVSSHHPTPALQKLSEYIRPRAPAPGVAEPPRVIPYGPSGPSVPPPQQGLDAYLRMPGAYFPPTIWEAMERDMVKDKREAWERDVEKMRQILAAQEFERLAAMAPAINPDTPYLEELQRVYGSLGVGALPPGMTPVPNVFPPPNIGVDMVQRERERLDVLRSSQEQQQQQQLAVALAASGNRANAAAVYQLFQKYSQDPAMLQRHMLALASPKDQELARMMDASSLIYHFARADPLAAAAAASGSSAPSAAVPAGLPPHFVPSGQEHPLVAMAQNYERMCAEMLSRPPYNTDAILAQQLMMQMSAQHDAIRHQLAMEREGFSAQPPPPPSLR